MLVYEATRNNKTDLHGICGSLSMDVMVKPFFSLRFQIVIAIGGLWISKPRGNPMQDVITSPQWNFKLSFFLFSFSGEGLNDVTALEACAIKANTSPKS